MVPMVETVLSVDTKYMSPPVWERFRCECGKVYSNRATLRRHERYECGKEPQFGCPYCPKRCKRKSNLFSHIRIRHKNVTSCQDDYKLIHSNSSFQE